MRNRFLSMFLVLVAPLNSVSAQAVVWTEISSPDTAQLPIVAIGGLPNGRIICGNRSRNFTSTDGGSTWKFLLGPASGFVAHPSGVIFGVDQFGAFFMPSSIWKSTDSGATWVQTAPISRYGAITEIGLTILPGGTIVRAENSSSVFSPHVAGYQIFVSKDIGQTFTGQYNEIGVDVGFPYAQSVRNIGRICLVATTNGILRSADEGLTWNYSNKGLADIPLGNCCQGQSVIQIAATSSGLVYALCHYSTGGVSVSADSGMSWQWTGAGLPSTVTSSDMVVDASGQVFVSFDGNGVYLARNSTSSWIPINSGLSELNVTALYLDNANYLYAGTSNGDIFRSLGPKTGVESPVESRPLAFSLDQNYPNPFNPSTTMRYALPGRAHVTLSVFNALGQLVAILVNEAQDAGYHELRFDGSALASGVYFYRLTAREYTATRKLIALK